MPCKRHPGNGVHALSLFRKGVPGMSCQEDSQGCGCTAMHAAPGGLGPWNRFPPAATLSRVCQHQSHLHLSGQMGPGDPAATSVKQF